MRLEAVDPQEQATILRGEKIEADRGDPHQTTSRRPHRPGRGRLDRGGGRGGRQPFKVPCSPVPATYAFGPQVYSGLIANRTWTLSGKTGNDLHGKVVLTNGTAKSLLTTYDEVIPNAVAKSTNHVIFTPSPNKIVNPDPVVQYDIDLAAGATETVSYSTAVGTTTGSWSTRLKTLANAQTTAQSEFLQSQDLPAPVTLATLTVAPSSLSMTVGQAATLAVSGTMSNGTVAPSTDLNDISWTSANAAVAGVTETIVRAVGPGSTIITVQSGPITKSIAVTVAAPVAPSSSSSAGSNSNGESTAGTTGNSGTSTSSTGGEN